MDADAKGAALLLVLFVLAIAALVYGVVTALA
jgi:hypothetical protein